MAASMWIRGENGVVHQMDLPLSPHIQHRLNTGDLVRVNEDGSPWTEPDEGDGREPVDEVPEDAPALPDRKANRPVWVEFAISQGIDREQAAAMTKADLIAEFTTEREAP
jgi:hypothetical protein